MNSTQLSVLAAVQDVGIEVAQEDTTIGLNEKTTPIVHRDPNGKLVEPCPTSQCEIQKRRQD
jgi:hypothetical protein